jgi:hypothetical protein
LQLAVGKEVDLGVENIGCFCFMKLVEDFIRRFARLGDFQADA